MPENYKGTEERFVTDGITVNGAVAGSSMQSRILAENLVVLGYMCTEKCFKK